MKAIKKTLIASLFVSALLSIGGGAVTAAFAADVTASGTAGNPYTVTQTFDEESGLLNYVKVEYSQNTYQTTNVTTLDATGNSVEVSDDANYVFIPCEYYAPTEDTVVSIKYRNDGAEYLPLHVEYGAGITSGGVDYDAGFKYVCVNALSTSSWNVSKSKSVDGYDVVSVQFGNYANEIYDVNLKGFRFYFDYGKTVTGTRSFEIFGLTVHEPDETPTFASDPKGCRLSVWKDTENNVAKGQWTIQGARSYSASVLDYDPSYTKLSLRFQTVGNGSVSLLIDGKTVESKTLTTGTQSIETELTQAIENVRLDFQGECKVTVTSSFGAKPYVDEFSGTGYTVNKQENGIQVSYTFPQGWYKLTAPIRQYNDDYDCLVLEFTLSHPIVMGILIDDTYIRNHYTYKETLPAGTHSFFFSLTELTIKEGSSLVIYCDPAITGHAGVSAEKTVTFSRMEFLNSEKMPKAEIQVDSVFTFDYDGKEHEASGATSNCGEALVYEYKLEGAPDADYDEAKPVDAGRYTVRVKSPLTKDYGVTYAYATLVINRLVTQKPSVSVLTFDYVAEKIYFDASAIAVSETEDFSALISNGSYVSCGMTLYFKYISSVNYEESEADVVTLSQKQEDVEISVDYNRETTKQNISAEQEYSTDGLNWTAGAGKKIKLEPGKIYLFRNKATENAFAGDVCYIASPHRVLLTQELTVVSNLANSVEVSSIGENAEYRLADTVWQEDRVFMGLTEGSEITVYARIKATTGSYASEEIRITVVVGQAQSSVTSSDGKNDTSKGCGAVCGSGLGIVGLAIMAVALKKRRTR